MLRTSASFWLTGEVAQRLGVSAERVRRLERTGRLTARRTETGIRLFDRLSVERFVQARMKESRWTS